ncbi:hypothetical protein IAR55_006270 [Kwoniella newhampshirensis]|uniref:GH18 domain-containing protein n=1 Tax=Kwoniella newhampshirensis TaxID=1651941 RepID=A0AAW0YV13_9TREE
MRRSCLILAKAAFVALVGTVLISAAPAPGPIPLPQADVSYTCDSDTTWHDANSKYTCQGGTVCKAGQIGNPCVWPFTSGAAAPAVGSGGQAATDAVAPAVSDAHSPTAVAAPTASLQETVGSEVASTDTASAPRSSSPSSDVSDTASDMPSDPVGSDGIGSPTSSLGADLAAGLPTTSAEAVPAGATSQGASTADAASNVTGSAPIDSTSPPDASSVTATVSGSAAEPSGNSTISVGGGGGDAGGRFVAYWQSYDNFGTESTPPAIPDLTGVTHVILAFVEMRPWDGEAVDTQASGAGAAPGGYEFQYSTDGNFTPDTVKQIKAKGVKVSAALGGWSDKGPGPIATMVRGGEASIDQFVEKAKGLVDAFGLDGLDLDWEFPTQSDSAGEISLLKKMRAKMPNAILSVALGARVDTSDAAAYTSDSIKQLNDIVDMYNVMTYDYVNRYSTVSDYQAGGKVVETVMKYYSGQDIDMKKCNIGFPLNAKYFKLPSLCTNGPLGCPLGGRAMYETNGVDNYSSGWLRFNPAIDKTLGTVVEAKMKQVRPQFDARPKSGTAPDPADLSQAWVDETNQMFWTWLEPSDISGVCQKWKSQVGGMMVWALNQDTEGVRGGPHLQAIADCLG